MTMTSTYIRPVESGDYPEYPLGCSDNLAGHTFLAWDIDDWLYSEMRLKGSEECRALYFDLIVFSQKQKPVGTLPNDMESLAKILGIDESRFRRLSEMQFGPLYKWKPCVCDGEVRLMHARVLQMVLEATARKHSNRARNDAANASKRKERLRIAISQFHAELAKNDAAILWMDDYLVEQGVGYRTAKIIEGAMRAWSSHVMDLRGLNRR